jgi:hypothetical protein
MARLGRRLLTVECRPEADGSVGVSNVLLQKEKE